MKKMKYLVILCSILFLSACSFGQQTEEKLSNILTELYESESDYRAVQSELIAIEKKEQANFQSMMELTKDQKEELTKQVGETSKLLEERLVLVEKEAASITKASEKLKQLQTLISETKDESEKANLEKMEEALKNRYAAYDALTEEYNSLASLQEELYNLLITEEAEVKTIQNKVAEVNKQNEVVKKAVEKFNELTTQLNKVKEDIFTSLQEEKK
ncbi:YkyA family protein [Bacillus sp. Cr_A10]|uniref:YkyA family protein n=1 Tax=Bacillaceae TaxID=186817 RepID=UPI0023D9E4B7|nr:YkyA family protein [Bacillus sp. Cr_A10]MDF2065656.1 YkyA family protein [Bacillus sp. Cr_A10]